MGLTPEATLALQFAMFIPALVAIVMNRFITKSSVYQGKAKWFINYYLIFTAEIFLGFIAISVLGLHEANPAILQITGAVTGVTGLLGTILLVALNIKPAWRADLEKAKLHFGSPRNYIIYAGLIAVFVTVGAYIDIYTGLGIDPATDFNILVQGAFASLILGPVLGLTSGVFGEEYGWRIYLQDLLTEQFGRPIGVIILGVIWGLWHAPAVLSGWTYPGYGLLGLGIYVVFASVLGSLLSHATFASGTVWVATYVHAVINGYCTYSLQLASIIDPVFNFRYGIYGLLILGVIILGIILRNKKHWGMNQ